MSNTRNNKPDCKLIGEDGNIFNLMARASKTLRKIGLQKKLQKCVNVSRLPAVTMRHFASSANM